MATMSDTIATSNTLPPFLRSPKIEAYMEHLKRDLMSGNAELSSAFEQLRIGQLDALTSKADSDTFWASLDSPALSSKPMTKPNKSKKIRCVGYLKPLFNVKAFPLVEYAVRMMILRSDVKFDAIAFRGASGSLLCPSLAMAMGKEMILVRKGLNEGEPSHSTYKTEGRTSGAHYIIVDDLIASGDTMNAIIEALPNSECVGIFLWLDDLEDEFFRHPVTKKKILIRQTDVRTDRKINALLYDGSDYE